MRILLAFLCASSVFAVAGSLQAIDLARLSSHIKCFEANDSTGTSKAVAVDGFEMVLTGEVYPLTKEGEIEPNADKQIRQALDNLEAALLEGYSSFDRVARIGVYLDPSLQASRVEPALAERFKDRNKPAVSFVSGKLGRQGALVAMDAVALSKVARNARPVRSPSAAFAVAGKCAVASSMPAGARYFIAGQAKNGPLEQATGDTLEALSRTLDELGLEKSNVAHVKAFMQPIEDIEKVEEEIVKYFAPALAPPVTFVEWASPTNTPIEIEMVAVKKGKSDVEGEALDFMTPAGMTSSKVFSRVAIVKGGPLIYLSGVYGADGVDAKSQLKAMFEELKGTLEKADSDFEHLAKATYYVTDDAASTALNEIRPEYYKPERPPAASKAVVRGVGMTNRSVTMDMIAVPK